MRNYEHGGDVFAEENRPIDFSVNINPLGMPAAAVEAAQKAVAEELSYPDPFCRRLTAALAKRYKVAEESIICGNGASDLMMRLCSYAQPEKVLVPAPGFSEYERCAQLMGSEVAEFSVLGEQSSMESLLSKAVQSAPDIIFICRPNNPDGSMLRFEEVKKLAGFCERRGIVLVCDECFLEFTQEKSAAELTEKYKKLVVINAFTKTYAMAGLRLGFMICSDQDLLDGTYACGSPWIVSAPAQAAAEVCCGETCFLEKSRQYIDAQRKKLVSGLEKLGLEVFPSQANFLLVREPQGLAEASEERPALREMLAQRGIKVRDCRTFTGLDDSCIRIGVRTEEENNALLKALEDIYG